MPGLLLGGLSGVVAPPNAAAGAPGRGKLNDALDAASERRAMFFLIVYWAGS